METAIGGEGCAMDSIKATLTSVLCAAALAVPAAAATVTEDAKLTASDGYSAGTRTGFGRSTEARVEAAAAYRSCPNSVAVPA